VAPSWAKKGKVGFNKSSHSLESEEHMKAIITMPEAK